MKTNAWVLIGWKKRGHEMVCAKVKFLIPKSAAQALAYFKSQRPGLRDYTVQIDTEAR